MRAFVITGPGRAEVRDIEPPEPGPGQVVVDVERAGVCGTDVEFYTGHMVYLRTGEARYPVRIGHEWCGRVIRAGDEDSASWIGQRVTGDTMLGCGHCHRCRSGRQHLCADRFEIGIRGGWPGALAEQLLVPASALLPLPEGIGPTAGALVEPGGNALRVVRATQDRVSQDRASQDRAGQRLLVIGPGTIGLLAALIARARGADVHLLGQEERSLRFARSLGFGQVWVRDTLPAGLFDAIIDASTGVEMPSLATELVEPGGRIGYIGLSAEPSLIDTRTLVLKDVTASGVLSASGGLAETIALYADGAVDPEPIVAATVGLADAATVLSGRRPPEWGDAPKVHIDPRS
ncbi:MAG TPA: alcohol dehydrogenase catalytic domain-containing protein [Streptosporangiaceae bacterium]